jgi:hypothetical protein
MNYYGDPAASISEILIPRCISEIALNCSIMTDHKAAYKHSNCNVQPHLTPIGPYESFLGLECHSQRVKGTRSLAFQNHPNCSKSPVSV